ncbi:MAG: hypothetical protein ACQES2_05810 [Pseudomonadota bacterium]
MPEIPEFENCCDKEPFAFFGLAAYYAQVLEEAALNLAVALRLPEVNFISQELFESLYESLGRRTFGQLLKAAKSNLELSDDDANFLEEALELRNMLVHRYFRERAEDFISEVGRRGMVKELQSILSEFTKADEILTRLYLPLWEQYGVSEAFVQAEFARMVAEAEHRDREK